MNKLSPIFFLLAACGPALAENTAGLMMPDGSRDMYVGMGIATRTAVAAGEDRPVSLRPLLQVQWSNGIFVSATGVVGMHLSETAGVEYGPLLVDSNSRDPGEGRRLRGTHPVKGSPDAGGFYNYYLGDNARILSSVVYDSSAHGFKGQLGAQKSWSSLAPHHTVSLSAGVSLASDPVARELYEVSTATGGVRDYRPSGGVMAVGAGVNWNWELSSKWLINSSVTGTRLGTTPAGSPIVERRNFITWSSGLAYRF
jgi:outer membrane scaffolding protein for murein synthesis (MipA/OmpV family)